MNTYIYINNNDKYNIHNQQVIIRRYIYRTELAKPSGSKLNYNHEVNEIDMDIDTIINMLTRGDQVLIAELKVLGNSIFDILKSIENANILGISIYSVNEDLLFSYENKTLLIMATSLFNIEKSLREKRLIAAKETRLKNGTKLGRKSGKKTKSMFDKHKLKIMKLHNQGVPKTRILAEIKKDDTKLKSTSVQALSQYIKRIERIIERKDIVKLFKKESTKIPITYD